MKPDDDWVCQLQSFPTSLPDAMFDGNAGKLINGLWLGTRSNPYFVVCDATRALCAYPKSHLAVAILNLYIRCTTLIRKAISHCICVFAHFSGRVIQLATHRFSLVEYVRSYREICSSGGPFFGRSDLQTQEVLRVRQLPFIIVECR